MIKVATGVLLAVMLANPAGAQTIQGNEEPFRIGARREVTSQFQEKVVNAPMAVLRGLDKLTGVARDIEISVNEPLDYGRLTLTLSECRYPSDNPTGNGYGLLTIEDRSPATGDRATIFQGWMVAASPALNALDHPRYDVWIKRCTLRSERVATATTEEQTEDPEGPNSPRPTMRP